MADRKGVLNVVRPEAAWRFSQKINDHLSIARPDHWFKNIFMLPGIALALALRDQTIDIGLVGQLVTALASTCLITSANYTINEWLDAETDRHHPVKRNRPSALGRMSPYAVYLQWCLLALAGIGLATAVNAEFLAFGIILLVMGVLYNVKPFRTKDRVYLDVLSESVNNPLRFMLGWSAVAPNVLPPSSILLAYWMGGAYLMAIKRYAEYRYIADPQRAALYRVSFRSYTEEKLLLSAFFYALMATFFLGVFLIKYKIEFIIAIPFLTLLFVWYLSIGMKTDSVTQNPERLYQERGLVTYVACLGALMIALFFLKLDWLNILVEYHVISWSSIM